MNNIYTYFTIILLSIVGLKCDLFPPDNTLLVCKLGALSEVLPICHHMKLDTIMTWNENITFTFYVLRGPYIGDGMPTFTQPPPIVEYNVIEIKYSDSITAYKNLLLKKYNENQLYINKYKDVNPMDLTDAIRDKINSLILQNTEGLKEISSLPDEKTDKIRLDFKLVNIIGGLNELYFIVGGHHVRRMMIDEMFYVGIFE